MSHKSSDTHISEDAFENIIENFHLGFAVAPAIAAVLATILGLSKTIHLGIELSFVFAVIIINFIILRHKSKTDKELNLFYTFRTNRLPPVQTGKEEIYKVDIAVIEDQENSYFKEALKDTFKKDLNLEQFKDYLAGLPRLKNVQFDEQRLRSNLLKASKDSDLYFRLIEIDHSKKYLEKSKWVADKLDKAAAVVVVRTGNLEEKSDIYEAVNLWAFQNQNSEVPILFAKNPQTEFPQINEVAEKFIPIPDDPKSLPWRLLKRAKERGRAWRIQAKYNRAMVWNVFYLALMCVYIGAIWIVAQEAKTTDTKAQYETTMEGMNDALITEKQFRKFTNIKDDEKLNVSYWYSKDGEPTLFATTEYPHTTYKIPKDKKSIIGCGLSFPNNVIEWKVDDKNVINPSNVKIYDNYNNEKTTLSPICQMNLLPTNNAKSIICAVFEGSGSEQSSPILVGICVFTENSANKDFKDLSPNTASANGSQNDNSANAPAIQDNQMKYRYFLRTRVEDYYNKHIKWIASGKVVPLEIIEKKVTPAPAH